MAKDSLLTFQLNGERLNVFTTLQKIMKVSGLVVLLINLLKESGK
jgi:hypothetical protein